MAGDMILFACPAVPAHVEAIGDDIPEDEPQWWRSWLVQLHPNTRRRLQALVQAPPIGRDLPSVAEWLGWGVTTLKHWLAHPVVQRRIEYGGAMDALDGRIADRKAIQTLWTDLAFDEMLDPNLRMRATELLERSRGGFTDRTVNEHKLTLAEALDQLDGDDDE